MVNYWLLQVLRCLPCTHTIAYRILTGAYFGGMVLCMYDISKHEFCLLFTGIVIDIWPLESTYNLVVNVVVVDISDLVLCPSSLIG
jgi:hypothetical protein